MTLKQEIYMGNAIETESYRSHTQKDSPLESTIPLILTLFHEIGEAYYQTHFTKLVLSWPQRQIRTLQIKKFID